ncbi:pilus assembly protein [Cupriavidus sp. 30B13]|uniref:pilus assembly protein n=1 Tax=Cupriavidus sp. 30B13 TaxID=3384241 RepID=UPI003B9126AF
MLTASPLSPLSPLCARQRAAGSTTLLLVGTMLLLVAATTAAGFHFLLSARQIGAYQLEREIAFRAAEAALLDAEADLLLALRAGATGADARLAAWPPPGRCADGAQRGLCRPAPGVPPVWNDWLDARGSEADTGIVVGTFTGAALPVLPAGVAGTAALPRYVVELRHERPPGEWLTPVYGGAGKDTSPRFRITALGTGRDRAVRALLQTEFQP